MTLCIIQQGIGHTPLRAPDSTAVASEVLAKSGGGVKMHWSPSTQDPHLSNRTEDRGEGWT